MPRVTIASTGGSVDVGWTSAQTDRALRAALAELTGLPAAESILLRDADDYFLFDRRLLRAGIRPPRRATGPPSRRTLPTERVWGGKPVDVWARCDVAIPKKQLLGFDCRTPQLRKVCRTA